MQGLSLKFRALVKTRMSPNFWRFLSFCYNNLKYLMHIQKKYFVITVLRLQIWQKVPEFFSKNLWKWQNCTENYFQYSFTVLKIIFSTVLAFSRDFAIWKGIFSTLCVLINLQTSNCNGLYRQLFAKNLTLR